VSDPSRESKVIEVSDKAKKLIAGVLTVLMFVLVAFATLELAGGMVRAIVSTIRDGSDGVALSQEQLLEAFSAFLTVLVGLELIETIEVYFKGKSIPVVTIMLVAITALARKVIVLDMAHYDPLAIVGLALLVAAFPVGYYFVRRAGLPEDAG